MAMVPINHTDRYAVSIFIDKYWAGDAGRQSGGGAAACCYPGLKDWSKPVKVAWTWGWEEDPKTKAVLKPDEQHTVVAHFPASGPHSDRDPMKDDAYVCVILRDLDKAELTFSPTATGCFDKYAPQRRPMTVRQAGAPIADAGFMQAAQKGGDALLTERFASDNKGGPLSSMNAKCRLYPELTFFFDGTNNNLERDLPLSQLSNVA